MGPEEDLAKVRAENERLSRDVTRLQSLVRVAQRSLGIEVAGKRKKVPARRRKPSHRGKKVVALLRKPKQDEAGGGAKAS